MFKPTLASGKQTFRTDTEGALSYFVGNNKSYPQDSGFALKGWKEYRFENAAVYIDGDLALTTGNVFLVNDKGQETVVDKSWLLRKMSKANCALYCTTPRCLIRRSDAISTDIGFGITEYPSALRARID